MANAFDTLGYAKALEGAGIERKQAEAHAEAIRDKVMPELATKADIKALEAAVNAMGDKITIRLGGTIVVVAGLVLAFLRLVPAS